MVIAEIASKERFIRTNLADHISILIRRTVVILLFLNMVLLQLLKVFSSFILLVLLHTPAFYEFLLTFYHHVKRRRNYAAAELAKEFQVINDFMMMCVTLECIKVLELPLFWLNLKQIIFFCFLTFAKENFNNPFTTPLSSYAIFLHDSIFVE